MSPQNGITSDLGVAQTHATAFATAASALESPSTVSDDQSTTVAGNAQAHQAIQAVIEKSQSIATALTTAAKKSAVCCRGLSSS